MRNGMGDLKSGLVLVSLDPVDADLVSTVRNQGPYQLVAVGYLGEATTQTPEAIRGIVLLFTVVPAAGHFLLIFIVTRYKLNQERCDEIRVELDRRQAGSSA